jgi:hypothetical protein
MEPSSSPEVLFLEEKIARWEKGMFREACRILLRLGEKRFGPPDPSTIERIEGIQGTRPFERVAKIESMIDVVWDLASWEELLASMPGSE